MHVYGMRRQNIIRRKKAAHFRAVFLCDRKDFEINSI